MENTLNIKNIEHDNYIEIFYPNGMILDGESIFFDYDKNDKYSGNKKSILLEIILKKYEIKNNDIVIRLKKCLSNGLNKFGSIEDNEFELLIKEFNDITDNEIKIKTNSLEKRLLQTCFPNNEIKFDENDPLFFKKTIRKLTS